MNTDMVSNTSCQSKYPFIYMVGYLFLKRRHKLRYSFDFQFSVDEDEVCREDESLAINRQIVRKRNQILHFIL